MKALWFVAGAMFDSYIYLGAAISYCWKKVKFW